MADWLTHVLVAYAVFRVASWFVDWLDERWIAVGLVGSILPDLSRLKLLIDSDAIAHLVGVSFDWSGLHTLGGIVLLSGIGAVFFRETTEQRKAFTLLVAGSLSHIVVDLPQRYADGNMILNSYTFPVPTARPPTPGWYVSPDRWVATVALLTALTVFLLDRHLNRSTDS